MVRRTGSTRPYVRIAPNTDPTSALKFLYGKPALGDSRRYGKPMAGDGLVTAKQNADEIRLQKPQDPVDRHGAGYDGQVNERSWIYGGDATKQPNFDSVSRRLKGKCSMARDRDFFEEAAHARAAEIAADVAEIDAGLMRARASGDDHTARELIQARANANAAKRNLETEYAAYCASQNPRREAPSTEGEWLSKPAEKMTGEDVSKIFERSKYVTRETWNDPEVQARVNAGWAEVQRRRRQGG
jgi:hypothetical protein